MLNKTPLKYFDDPRSFNTSERRVKLDTITTSTIVFTRILNLAPHHTQFKFQSARPARLTTQLTVRIRYFRLQFTSFKTIKVNLLSSENIEEEFRCKGVVSISIIT